MFEAYYKGFLIVDSYESDGHDEHVDYMDRQHERLDKYRKRGFHIDIDDSKDVNKVLNLCERIYPYKKREEMVRYIQWWDHFRAPCKCADNSDSDWSCVCNASPCICMPTYPYDHFEIEGIWGSDDSEIEGICGSDDSEDVIPGPVIMDSIANHKKIKIL